MLSYWGSLFLTWDHWVIGCQKSFLAVFLIEDFRSSLHFSSAHLPWPSTHESTSRVRGVICGLSNRIKQNVIVENLANNLNLRKESAAELWEMQGKLKTSSAPVYCVSTIYPREKKRHVAKPTMTGFSKALSFRPNVNCLPNARSNIILYLCMKKNIFWERISLCCLG